MLESMQQDDDGLWRVRGSTLPLSFTLKARRL
jgi:hypothetical protein